MIRHDGTSSGGGEEEDDVNRLPSRSGFLGVAYKRSR